MRLWEDEDGGAAAGGTGLFILMTGGGFNMAFPAFAADAEAFSMRRSASGETGCGSALEPDSAAICFAADGFRFFLIAARGLVSAGFATAGWGIEAGIVDSFGADFDLRETFLLERDTTGLVGAGGVIEDEILLSG